MLSAFFIYRILWVLSFIYSVLCNHILIRREDSMDDMSFFHQATVLICGSLDIDKAVRECFAFLKQHIPLELMELSIFDPEINSIRVLASHATFQIMRNIDEPRPLSRESLEYIKNKKSKSKMFFINSSLKTTPPLKDMSAALGIDQVVGMGLPLGMDKKELGMLTILARGTKSFEAIHGHLLSLLHDPFAMAMSNHLRYREVVKLKDMLFDDNQYLHKELHKITGDEIVGKDYGLQRVMEMVRQVASLDSSVLLLGETGVGKEVIANALHYFSSRRNGPLIKVNCGAIPEGLMDSELFGHEKGAFTGALFVKRGRFERANKGTIFLDEIGELPPAAQVRLLRVLQDHKIERVGGTKSISLDVRIIAATHKNLENMVQKGQFREDLWYRINVFPITIPPLRHRKSDIPAFVEHFIQRKLQTLNLRHSPSLSSSAIQRLQQYDWPGNVRELENAVERELIKNQVIGANSLLEFREFAVETSQQNPPAAKPSYTRFRSEESTTWQKAEENSSIDRYEDLSLDSSVRQHILRILKITGGRIQGKDGAAELLGVNHSTLRHRMRKLNISFGKKSSGNQ